MAEWVDFSKVKQCVSMADILTRYELMDGMRRRKGGDGLIGKCPFHQGKSKEPFNVSLSKNAWRCFGCRRHGNIFDFVAAKESTDIRGAALLIQSWFPIASDKDT